MDVSLTGLVASYDLSYTFDILVYQFLSCSNEKLKIYSKLFAAEMLGLA